jgi:multimeric flavodoxin WrbA
MKIAIINGTDKKNSTYNLKEMLLTKLGELNTITEYYMPKDLPILCKGCLNCVNRGLIKCPQIDYMSPIKDSLFSADLIIIATPVYVGNMPGGLKNFFDHFSVLTMSHRPDKFFFKKHALILVDASFQGTSATIQAIRTQLDSWGIGKTFELGFNLEDSRNWEDVTETQIESISDSLNKVIVKLQKSMITKNLPQTSIKKLFFEYKKWHLENNKKYNNKDTLDYEYWYQNGWFNTKTPWIK